MVLEPLMAIDEVAEILGISERGVFRLISRSDLVAVKVGNCTRIEPQESAGSSPSGASRPIRGGRTMTDRTAVVLLSGGLDSSTVLAIAQPTRDSCPHAISFRYGQRHAVEFEAAREIAEPCRGRAARRGRDRPAPVRRLGPHRRHRRAEGPRARRDGRAASRSPTCPRATRSSSPSPWPGPRCLGANDIFIGRQRARLLRLPGLPAGVHRGLRADGQPRHQARRRGPAPDDPHPADRPDQGRDHRARSRTRRRLLP